MKLHIFNPENDMALANGSPGYTPPANIRAYRRQHWELPRKWTAPEDVVWDGEAGLGYLFRDEAKAPEICPWGWSPALVHELELAGVPRHMMPDREWLDKLRTLSGRQSTVQVQRVLGLDATCCDSLDDVLSCLSQWEAVIMKSPWSSSGKGLMQTIFKLDDGSALDITVAKYNPPKSPNFDGVGVVPDYEVKLTQEQEVNLALLDHETDPQLRKATELVNAAIVQKAAEKEKAADEAQGEDKTSDEAAS